jgi:hypothetical protein
VTGKTPLAIGLRHHLPDKKTVVAAGPVIPTTIIHPLIGLILTHIDLRQRPTGHG